MLSRRQFLGFTRYLPAVAIAPLAQYGYTEPLPPPGADTPVNLTIRMTVQEMRLTIVLAIIKEQGDLIRWAVAQLRQTGDPWGTRKRAT